MSLSGHDISEDRIQVLTKTEKFSKLFSELEHCNEEEQRKKIEEMNGLIDGMNMEEFISIFTKKLFNKIHQMIEKKTLSLESAIVLLKHVGYSKELKLVIFEEFEDSLLNERFVNMIIEEGEKKEKKNEKLLADLCLCYISLEYNSSPEMISICMPYLLKVALKKVENKEVQKEVEMALLILSNYNDQESNKGKYLKAIKEIIKYHQEHHNLTRLAYQSALQFLIYRLPNYSLEEVIVNELHFAREAIRELEESSECIDWKREKGKEDGGIEAKKELILLRWMQTLSFFFRNSRLWNEECSEFIYIIVQVFRAARENERVISDWCICSLRDAAINKAEIVKGLLKGGAIDLFLDEIRRQTLKDITAFDILMSFRKIPSRLKEEEDDEKEKAKRKEVEMELFKKMEDEGYEDIIISFYETFDFLNEKYHDALSLDISDYFVNI
ncbi:uncharacterized protein MONOS_17773 [Monocercomonoides exilis]|uniref:uncharacterized protein n=1 Tax=Monocercomonoides exilis TaxID=2049356 RepID=UPI00355951F4|nr:hypothetical protein MONOS_17773 [Monocercomonoides exilis]